MPPRWPCRTADQRRRLRRRSDPAQVRAAPRREHADRPGSSAWPPFQGRGTANCPPAGCAHAVVDPAAGDDSGTGHVDVLTGQVTRGHPTSAPGSQQPPVSAAHPRTRRNTPAGITPVSAFRPHAHGGRGGRGDRTCRPTSHCAPGATRPLTRCETSARRRHRQRPLTDHVVTSAPLWSADFCRDGDRPRCRAGNRLDGTPRGRPRRVRSPEAPRCRCPH
jgi:hypothetical protein